MRITSETFGTILNTPTFELQASQRKKKKGNVLTEKIFEEIIVENFPNMGKEIIDQVQEAQRDPYRLNPRRNMPRQTVTTLTKTKHNENIKRSQREATSNIQGKSHTLNSSSFSRNSAGQREWQGIFKVLKGKNLQPRLPYLARISFKIDGEIKSFSDKQKLKEFSTTKPALQQMLKGLI